MTNIENCKKEPEAQLDEHQKNLKNFENEDKKQDWSVLSGFWKMLGNFIDGKKIENPSQKNKAEDAKRGAIIEASNILNDKNLNADGKKGALEKLFKSFEENKDAFPQTQEQVGQSQNSQKDKSEKFLGDLMKTIWENRVASQETNANFKNRLPDKWEPPYKNPIEAKTAAGSLEKLNWCM